MTKIEAQTLYRKTRRFCICQVISDGENHGLQAFLRGMVGNKIVDYYDPTTTAATVRADVEDWRAIPPDAQDEPQEYQAVRRSAYLEEQEINQRAIRPSKEA